MKNSTPFMFSLVFIGMATDGKPCGGSGARLVVARCSPGLAHYPMACDVIARVDLGSRGLDGCGSGRRVGQYLLQWHGQAPQHVAPKCNRHNRRGQARERLACWQLARALRLLVKQAHALRADAHLVARG